MHWVRITVAVFVLMALGISVYAWLHRVKTYPDALRSEIALQEPEIKQCHERLALIYTAWAAYRKDHKGQEPPSPEALIPKYIRDVHLFLCPTAERWRKKRGRVSTGFLTIKGQSYPESYEFKWLTSGATRAKRLHGEQALLAVCEAHHEGLYLAGYKKAPPLGLYTSDRRDSLVPEVRNAKMLIVRRNGTVEDIDPAGE